MQSLVVSGYFTRFYNRLRSATSSGLGAFLYSVIKKWQVYNRQLNLLSPPAGRQVLFLRIRIGLSSLYRPQAHMSYIRILLISTWTCENFRDRPGTTPLLLNKPPILYGHLIECCCFYKPLTLVYTVHFIQFARSSHISPIGRIYFWLIPQVFIMTSTYGD